MIILLNSVLALILGFVTKIKKFDEKDRSMSEFNEFKNAPKTGFN